MKSPESHCCNGVHGVDEAHIHPDNRHILVLVDRNATHRREVKAVLNSLYNIVEFDEAGKAQEYIHATLPGAVLMSEDIPHKEREALFGLVHRDKLFASMPMLLILSNGNPERVAAAKASGATGWLAKPYLGSALINLLSGAMNASVEKQWESLPQVQAKALKGTVEMFNSLSDVIEKGGPIAYNEVSTACLPLVEAINSDNYKGILSGVRDHDNYTYAHSLRVALFLALFGRTIGLPEKDQRLLATGGLLHDVGKMLIPHLVLNKPGRLTAEEFVIMKGHVDASVRILSAGGNIPKGVITIAGQHHEKLDGTGYPNGLAGSELNELARMASIVDVFSALTDRRVYKPSMAPEKALSIMTDEMSGHLDMSLLARFRQMLLDAAVE